MLRNIIDAGCYNSPNKNFCHNKIANIACLILIVYSNISDAISIYEISIPTKIAEYYFPHYNSVITSSSIFSTVHIIN